MNFRIPRYSDEFLVDNLVKVARDNALPQWSIHVQYHFANGQTITETIPKNDSGDWRINLSSSPLLREAIAGKIVGAKKIALVYAHIGEVFYIDRGDLSHPSDSACLAYISDQGNRDEMSRRAKIGREIYTLLSGISGTKSVPAMIGDELGKFVESRDAGLARLEELYARFTDELVSYRKQIDDSLAAGRKKNEEELSSEREKLAHEVAAKEAKLRERENALEERLKVIDDRTSHHVRRELRGSMRTELKERSVKFELTEGTRRLRWPVAATLIVAGAAFLVGAIYMAIAATDAIKSPAETNWPLIYIAIKQVTFTAGFISILWYAVKWNDRWFREHAEEEFRAKALQLDIERASWVVETALAWKQERGTEMPPALLDRISQNLFADRSKAATPEPGSISLNEFLGSASKVRAKLGDHAELEFDRKGVQKLSQSGAE